MELKIKDRDYVADGAGGLVRVSGWDELLERVLFKLSVTGMELAEKNGFLELRVLLRYENETGEAVVTIGGE